MHLFLKNQVLVFNHIPLEAGACFFFKIGVCFYEGPPKRSSCRDSNESHVYNYIHTHLYIYTYIIDIPYNAIRNVDDLEGQRCHGGRTVAGELSRARS